MNTQITNPKLNTLSNRLVYALELTGTRKVDLAKAIDVKPQIIQFLCDSSTRSSRFTFEIATALGLNTRWLATGEGEMFLADDPNYKLLNKYKPTPFLTNEQLLAKIQNIPTDANHQNEWVALNTKNENVFCMQIQDASMEPILPINSIVFFEEISEYNLKNLDIALIYIPQYNSFVIREIVIEDSEIFMNPKNAELFKKASITKDMSIIGIAIECHWKIRR